MRIVIVLLLLANVTLYLYTRLDTGGGEAVLLQDQVQPDKIKLLTPQQVAALGPAKVAALNDVCVEWGPFSDVDRSRALSDIEPLALGRLVSQKKVDFDNGYWVNMGPFATRPSAENRVAELRRQGLKEKSVADAPKGQFAISFGNFSWRPRPLPTPRSSRASASTWPRSSGATSRCRRRSSSCAIRSRRSWRACASSSHATRAATCARRRASA